VFASKKKPFPDVRGFSTFCPKAVAGIGCLADTVADRSIPIRLKRKLPSEKVDYLDDDQVRPVAESLSRGSRTGRVSSSPGSKVLSRKCQLSSMTARRTAPDLY
jgi:hypothetical protein